MVAPLCRVWVRIDRFKMSVQCPPPGSDQITGIAQWLVDLLG